MLRVCEKELLGSQTSGAKGIMHERRERRAEGEEGRGEQGRREEGRKAGHRGL